MEIKTCENSKEIDEYYGSDLTPYTDVECKSDEEVYAELDQSIFLAETMMISQTFNPYTYYEQGTIQTTTRVDGSYFINYEGNYEDTVVLRPDTQKSIFFYAN